MALAVPTLPTISPTNLVNITDFGAVSSTSLTNTTAIQNAINFASGTNGGATVEIPAGTYLSGPLTLKSKVNLQIDSGATLQMLPMSSWPNASTPFILGSSISDVEISGSGTIDGQGSAWWSAYNSSGISRPNFIQFSSCNRILIQDVTLQNPPTFHIMIKNNNVNITIRRITINTPGTSPNTDGFDIASTNVLIQDSYVSDGDDNVEIGGSQPAAYVTVTNCTFGTGHGVSFGSITSGGVSNITVVNCTFSGTDYGIRLKSDNASSGGGSGGLCQNFFFANIGMTNITKAPIVIYSYYNEVGTPTGVTPQTAAGESVDLVTSTTVVWRNLTFSNINVTAPGVIAGIIWGRTEMPVTNVLFSRVNISAAASFDVYNAAGVQFADSRMTLPAGNSTYTLYNALLTVTNSAFATNLVTLDGLTTNGYGNSLALYNSRTSLKNTNAFDNGPLTIADSILTVSNNFTLFPTTVLNYVLDANTNRVAVVGNLTMGGTINVTNGTGFGAGTNTLLTYTGTLSGALPTLGSTPGGSYTYTLVTNIISKQVNLVVASTSTTAPTTNTVQSSANPSVYGTVVTFTATVSPAPTNGEIVTFKDGSTTLGTGTLSGGQATFNTTTTQLAAVSHSVTAVYAGDGAYGPSTSSAMTQTVNPLGLTITGLTVNNKIYDGTLAATLSTNGYVLNTVVGGDVVTLVTNGSTAAFASANVANGIAVTVAGLSLGGAQATNYALAQPTGLTANITPAGSSILLVSSNNPVAHLAAVSFTANVTPSTLSGSVLFLTNGTAFDNQTLSGGVATSATTTQLPRGTNLITARYSGNANYSPSTNTLNQVVTNNPPIANPATYYRLVGYPLTIVITNLATNWSDVDGDAMVLTNVNNPSTNGGTVTYDSTNIYYSDSTNVTDRFGYTISDGQGGTASGVVTILMAQQTVSGGTANGDGSVTLSFSGIPGNIYWVETTTDLTPPVVWMPIGTNTAGTNGLWQFTDPQATNHLQGFYRTQSSP